MPAALKRRWFAYRLRTLFVVVTAIGLGVFPPLKWIMERRAALAWVGAQAAYWHDLPVSQRTLFGSPAPWPIRILGEAGVERISVVVEKEDEVAGKKQQLERLFPEADVMVLTPGPGYVGQHAPQ